jgi:hypothetical protein
VAPVVELVGTGIAEKLKDGAVVLDSDGEAVAVLTGAASDGVEARMG